MALGLEIHFFLCFFFCPYLTLLIPSLSHIYGIICLFWCQCLMPGRLTSACVVIRTETRALIRTNVLIFSGSDRIISIVLKSTLTQLVPKGISRAEHGSINTPTHIQTQNPSFDPGRSEDKTWDADHILRLRLPLHALDFTCVKKQFVKLRANTDWQWLPVRTRACKDAGKQCQYSMGNSAVVNFVYDRVWRFNMQHF